MPTYSIIIPLYNKERQIARTLDSVLRQTMPDFEAIVVDDGSRDKSAEVVQSYTDSRIRYVRKENEGVSSARNRGIAEARGEWLLFLDADDLLLPDALATFEAMKRRFPKCRLFIAEHHNLRNGTCPVTNNASFVFSKFPYRSLWLNRFWPCPGNTIVHRSLLDQYGDFDERMSFYEDFDFFLRMMKGGGIVYTKKVVLHYYQEDGGLSCSRHSEKKEMAYYLPEKKLSGFFQKAVYYENVEYEINWWRDDPEVRAYYENLRKTCFSPIFAVVHWVRQKMVRRHII